jgi:hypothetical protein
MKIGLSRRKRRRKRKTGAREKGEEAEGDVINSR